MKNQRNHSGNGLDMVVKLFKDNDDQIRVVDITKNSITEIVILPPYLPSTLRLDLSNIYLIVTCSIWYFK